MEKYKPTLKIYEWEFSIDAKSDVWIRARVGGGFAAFTIPSHVWDQMTKWYSTLRVKATSDGDQLADAVPILPEENDSGNYRWAIAAQREKGGVSQIDITCVGDGVFHLIFDRHYWQQIMNWASGEESKLTCSIKRSIGRRPQFRKIPNLPEGAQKALSAIMRKID